MPQKGLVGSRVAVDRLYALLPPESVPASTLPEWTQTDVRILTAPAMGAGFAQYQLDVRPTGGTTQTLSANVQSFFYVQSGQVRIDSAGQAGRVMDAGAYLYLPPGAGFTLEALQPARVLWLRKRFEPFGAAKPREVAGREQDLKGEAFMEMPELILKKLLPEEPGFDMAMNIFTFAPGHGLPLTETHVMEHGLIMLQGQGLYFLGNDWREVQQGDFIWMGPFCPQSFFATGTTPARYIYYKNVNRDVDLG